MKWQFKDSRKTLIISVAVMIAAAIVIISAVTALRGRDSLQIDGVVYTYINGMEIVWEDGVRLTKEDDIISLDGGDGKQQLSVFPLLKEDGTIVLQRNYSWNRTSEKVIYKIDYFTEIERGDDGIRMKRRGKKVGNLDGFLYDNKDTYVFLEPAVLYIGGVDGRQIEIKPMTVVQVSFRDYIQIYSPDLPAVWLEEADTDEVMAVFEDGRRINLSIDQLYMKNGAWRLLYMPLDELAEMGTGGGSNEK